MGRGPSQGRVNLRLAAAAVGLQIALRWGSLLFGSRRRLPMDQCCALWASMSMLAGEQFLTFRGPSEFDKDDHRRTTWPHTDNPHVLVGVPPTVDRLVV